MHIFTWPGSTYAIFSSSHRRVLPAQELEKIVSDYKKLASQDRETLLKLAAAQ